jgi:hypothetical protein
MNFEIAAVSYISISEIQKVRPEITWEYVNASTSHKKALEQILFDLGMNIKDYPYEVQNVQHRNKFNEIVTCERFVGLERLDKEWLSSGYASEEAKDKSKSNKLLTDLYVQRGVFTSKNFN